MARIEVTGMGNIQRNLSVHISMIKKKALEGMIEAAIDIKNTTEKSLPVTPVYFVNLRSSMFITTALGNKVGENAIFKKGEGAGDKRRVLTAKQLSTLVADHSRVMNNANQECVSDKNISLIMGYTANYAIWVHEMVDAGINWSRPGSGPRWFQMAINANRDNILKRVGSKVSIVLNKGFKGGFESTII